MRAVSRACGRVGVRCQSSTAASTAPVAAASAVAPAAPTSATTLPALSNQEASARGLKVTDPGQRFQVENTGHFTLEQARKSVVLCATEDETKGRKVTIYKPSQSAMTSGTAASKSWAIRFNSVDKWDNQLMGWLSSSDTLQTPASVCKFESVEQAVLFCERNGLEYEVQEPHSRSSIATESNTLGNQYAYNFLSLEVQSHMKAAGSPRKARNWFANPDSPAKAGVSTWVNFRKTDFGPDAWRPRTDIGQGKTAWTGPEWAPAKKAGGSEEEHH